MEKTTANTVEGKAHSSILPSMNLSNSSDAMQSIVSWCRIVSSAEESLSTGRHKHFNHELHYIYEGELRFSFDELAESSVCAAGRYIFIPSGVIHTIEDLAPCTRKLVIGFDIVSRNEVIRKFFEGSRVPAANEETPTFRELARALMHKSSTSNLISSISIACIVHTLLLEVVDASTAHDKNKEQHLRESEDSRRIYQILSFINQNVPNNINVEDVANAVGLSVRQTSRVCHRLFGYSLNQLIIHIRLKAICTLLTDSKHSIAEIAEIAGFASPYSFSRHFSHYTGVTPSSYRRNYEIRH